MDDIALVVGADWTVDYVNKALTGYAGTHRAGIRGLSVVELADRSVASTDRGRSERALARAFDRTEADTPGRVSAGGSPKHTAGWPGSPRGPTVARGSNNRHRHAHYVRAERKVARRRASRYSAVETRFTPGSIARVAQNTGPPSQSLCVRRYQASR